MGAAAASLLEDGFDLLFMEEEEYLFQAIPCRVSHPTLVGVDRTLPASLRLGSQSMYVCPHDRAKPVLRIPLTSIDSLTLSLDEPETQNDEDITLVTKISKYVVIPRQRNPQPHSTIEDACQVLFVLQADTGLLPRLEELRDIALNGGQGKEEENAAAERLKRLITEHENAAVLNGKAIEKFGEPIELQLRTSRISPLISQPGWFALTESCVYFQPYHSPTQEGTRRWSLASVTGAGRRKYDLRNVAIEVFFQGNDPPVFFSFQTGEDRNSFEAALKKRVPSMEGRGGYSAASLSQWTREWVAGNISNSRYLSILNEAAGRSINDFTQYPIFPWVLTDYVSTTLDLDDPAVFRDLSRPIAALNNARLQHGRETYEAMKPIMGQDRAWMYGSHYSNPGIVVFYLLRSCPNLMLRLQNGRFDVPERLFSSVGGAWASVTKWNSDVKELIPEFYTPGGGQFLIEPAEAGSGQCSSGESTALQDVALPPWATSPEDFISKMAGALEAPAVSLKLHKWIDLIFGVKSRGKAALKADNLFHYMTDDATALAILHNETDPTMQRAYQAQTREYGRTPAQLFTKKHPKRRQRSTWMPNSLGSCVCLGPSTGGKKPVLKGPMVEAVAGHEDIADPHSVSKS